jgi:N-formylglutamate deformylase
VTKVPNDSTNPAPFVWREPTAAMAPLVVDSPHSGMTWPAGWSPAAPRDAILTTWDAFVDELWADVPTAGGALLVATAPRAFIDVNRAVTDVDPDLLDAPWPTPLTPTDYTARGMGLIRRFALPDVPMYDAPLSVAAVEQRIAEYYQPYRRTLAARLDAVHDRFGAVWHLNCHSMKSRGNAMNVDAGAARPDVVVSDRHGSSADPQWTAWAAQWFRDAGLSATINAPYQGGDIVRAFGAPPRGRHSIQVEFNRALYLDERAFERGARFAEVRALCASFTRALVVRITAEVP